MPEFNELYLDFPILRMFKSELLKLELEGFLETDDYVR